MALESSACQMNSSAVPRKVKAGHTLFPYKMQLYLTSCLHSNYYTWIMFELNFNSQLNPYGKKVQEKKKQKHGQNIQTSFLGKNEMTVKRKKKGFPSPSVKTGDFRSLDWRLMIRGSLWSAAGQKIDNIYNYISQLYSKTKSSEYIYNTHTIHKYNNNNYRTSVKF